MGKIKWDDLKCIHFVRRVGLCNREGDLTVYPEGHSVGGSDCLCWDYFGWPKPGARTEDCEHYVVENRKEE